MFGRYQSNLGFDHWKAVKKTLQYLQGAKDFTLTYKKADNLKVWGYSDADYNSHLDSIKSTSRNLFTLSRGAILWKSFKHSITATSTMHA
jgi:hypothetical protein